MSGITPELDTKSETVSCKPDRTGHVLKWVCDGLGDSPYEYGANVTFGIWLGNKLIGGIIINDIRDKRDAWLTIYTINKRWCTRKVLHLIFHFIFDIVNAERASIFVSKDNELSRKLVKKLGFEQEGLLRHYREDGQDCYVYGMLKSECKWRSKK